MDEVERFRSGMVVFLVLLPFVLFAAAFIFDKVRTALYKPLDDDEEEFSDLEMSSLEETLYLDSIPGMTKSILDGAKESIDDCTPEEKVKF